MLPDWSAGNPYQRLLVAGLSAQGVVVSMGQFVDGYFPLNRSVPAGSGVKVLHLHWVGDLLAPLTWSDAPVKRIVKRALLALDVWMLRLRGVTVVWTIHNLVSHETLDAVAEISARRTLARVCTRLILHSQGALALVQKVYRTGIDSKAWVIPHGNYDSVYPENSAAAAALRAKCRIDQDAIVILCFGAIRAYKDLGRLLDVFSKVGRRELRLIVAGRPYTSDLAEEVRSRARVDAGIVCCLEHVPSEQVSAYFEVAHIVAVPSESTLTSGSAILALTMARPLLLPRHARVLDAANEDAAIFYDSAESLQRVLMKLERDTLVGMRDAALRLAAERGWGEVARLTRLAYSGVPIEDRLQRRDVTGGGGLPG